jgi:predicted RNA binding protein YcfA (HicA-like mRNA interferase family)
VFGVDSRGRGGHFGGVKVREVLQRLHEEGWVLRRQKGSHRQFFHTAFPERRVTVSGQSNLDIPKGTLNSIFKQAGWK